MNYKSIIKSQNTRLKILSLLAWVPDSLMVRLQYRIQLGFWPNLKHPQRFTEKLQVYKLKYRNPLMHKCVDKYEVREYVKNLGLGHILNELYGVYDRAEDIDLSKLPMEFVAKTTDGTGGFNVMLVSDKNTLNRQSFCAELNGWLGKKDINAGREWAYTGENMSRIIVEKRLHQVGGNLTDYKFFCFDGEVRFLYVMTDRKDGVVSLAICDTEFNRLPYSRGDERTMQGDPVKPDNFKEMLEVSRILSRDFPHVRVDLYNIEGKIIFGELTFYDGSGYFHFVPDEFDYIVGSYFKEIT